MLRSASAAVLSSSRRHNIRSSRSSPDTNSSGTLGSSTNTASGSVKPHGRKVLVGLCAIVLVGCVLSSLSIMLGHSGRTAVRGHQQPTLKLVVAELQQGQQTVDTGAPGSKQTPGHGTGTSNEPVNSSDSSSQQQAHAESTLPTTMSATAAIEHADGRQHSRLRQRQPEQQAVQQQLQGGMYLDSNIAHVASVTMEKPQALDEGRQLPLPQALQAKLSQQQVTAVPAATPYADAAQGKSATSIGGLQVLPRTGGQQAVAEQQLLEQNPGGEVVANDVHPDDATSKYIAARGVAPVRLKYPVWWHGPIWAGSGYGSEAINYLLSLVRTGRLAPADVWAYHHGDQWNEAVVNALAEEDKQELEYLQLLPVRYRSKRAAVVVCHSVPTNWAFPDPLPYAGAPCPPNPREFGWVYTVGRTMFETDRLPALFVPRLNAMNEVWVPSEWQRESFIVSGVAAEKLVVVPEGVNTTLFDPARYTAMDLASKAQLVFGKPWVQKLAERQQGSTSSSSADGNSSNKHGDSTASGGSSAEALFLESSKTVFSTTKESASRSDRTTEHSTEQGLQSGEGTEQGLQTGEGTDRPSAAVPSAAIDSGTTDNDTVDLKNRSNSEGGSGDSTAGSSKNSETPDFAGSSRSSRNASMPFRFISTFKWERRKGWDILLEAYLSEFTAEDDVELYILTKPFDSSGTGFKDKMRNWAKHLQSNQAAGRGSQTASRHKHLNAAAGKFRFVNPRARDPARRLQQQQEVSGLLSHKQECSGTLGSTNCSAAAAAAAARGTDSAVGLRLQSGGSSMLENGAEQHMKVHAGEVVLQIWQFVQQLSATAAVRGSRDAEQRQQQQLRHRQLSGIDAGMADKEEAAAVDGQQQATGKAAESASAKYPTLYVVNSHISDANFPRFYKAGDAFVLPTRGEGWGRPHVEAMAMGLPVISTNWSGITAYLDETVGYPLAVERLVPVEGSEVIWWFKGLKWAQPSVPHLRQLMRHVYSSRGEAAARGRAARQLMVDKYSPEPLADLLVKQLQRIEAAIP